MSDGAHMGITANRAIKTIIGGSPEPQEDERATPEETRERIEAMPLFKGPSPWEVAEAIGTREAKDEAYGAVADTIAHAFLVLMEEDPSLLEPRPIPDTYPSGEPMDEHLRGRTMERDTVLWEALKARWPDADDWLGGATGFQVGFGLNAALYAASKPPVANPAIMTVRESG